MKTTVKLALSLMLVALMAQQTYAQNSLFSLNAAYAPPTSESEIQPIASIEWDDEFENKTRRRDRMRRRYDDRGDFFSASTRFDIDKYYPRRGTSNFVNVYIGLNNYLQDDDLPSSSSTLSLNPINSFYGALSFDNITNILGPLYVDWGIGVSVQDFSFENTRARVIAGEDEVNIVELQGISGRKSRLTMSHINVHFVPTISFGRYSSFRVGFGVYAGYRVGSHTKVKYDDANGETKRERIRDNYFLNPFKYGFRGTVGWRGWDIFVNYDVTELFEDDVAAPRLNPVSFGVIL